MKIHKRHVPVRKAQNELSLWLVEWMQRHDLTHGEIVRSLADEMQAYAVMMVRQEREETKNEPT